MGVFKTSQGIEKTSLYIFDVNDFRNMSECASLTVGLHTYEGLTQTGGFNVRVILTL